MAGKKSRQASQSKREFVVEVDRRVDALIRDSSTPQEVRVAYVAAYEDFARRGCEAATYRLSGPAEWPRFCVKRLPRNFRLVVIFPDASTVRLILLEEHSNTSDPYSWIEEVFALPDRSGRGHNADIGKPGCCDDKAQPPDGGELAELLDAVARRRR